MFGHASKPYLQNEDRGRGTIIAQGTASRKSPKGMNREYIGGISKSEAEGLLDHTGVERLK